MWECPKCQRSFKTKNQWHSCVIVNIDAIFLGKPNIIKELYNELLKNCIHFGKIKIDTTLSCIYFMDKNRFLAIKPQKSGIIIEFILERSEEIFPVIKIVQISKNQFVHRLKLDSIEDINDQLIRWIKDAYDLKNM